MLLNSKKKVCARFSNLSQNSRWPPGVKGPKLTKFDPTNHISPRHLHLIHQLWTEQGSQVLKASFFCPSFLKCPSFVLLFPNVLPFTPNVLLLSFFCPSFGHPVLLFFCRICSHLTSHFAKNCLRCYKLTILSKSSFVLLLVTFPSFCRFFFTFDISFCKKLPAAL